jgi:hypothetical protein
MVEVKNLTLLFPSPLYLCSITYRHTSVRGEKDVLVRLLDMSLRSELPPYSGCDVSRYALSTAFA